MKIDISNIINARPFDRFQITRVQKENATSKFQRNTTVKDGKATQSFMANILSVEDRGDYLYISYSPCGKDAGMCSFGCGRVYKDSDGMEYGMLGVELIRR